MLRRVLVLLSLLSSCAGHARAGLANAVDQGNPRALAAQVAVCESKGDPFSMLAHLCICEPCHVCEFDVSEWACQVIEGADAEDGSKEAIQQPELDAASWFLTEKEMTASRGGVARDDLALFTANNSATTYVASSEYYSAVLGDLERAGPGDRIFATGWSFQNVPLVPSLDAQENEDARVAVVLERAIKRGAEFHALGWTNLIETDGNKEFQALVNAMKPPRHGKARFIFDDRGVDFFSTNHQKMVVIKRAEGLVAYVGGLDLTANRWDSIKHDQTKLRRSSGIQTGELDGWIDIQVKLDGPAAKDVATTFLSRWNMERRPLQDFSDRVLPFENPEYSDLPALADDSPLIMRTSGHHSVQIARTFSCQYEHYDDFAPHGEISILQSRLKAIKMAQNYIYIEDQYYVEEAELREALLEVLPRLQSLIIVTQPQQPELVAAGYDKFQFDAITPLQEAFPNKVKVFRPKEDRNLFVHSKLVIIDDVFLSIGSANWNQRSMTSDSEIAANIVDTKTVDTPEGITVSFLARDYRIRKFMELTGKEYDELNDMTVLEASAALDGAIDDPKSILDSYQVGRDISHLVLGAMQGLVDRLDVCS